MESTNASSLISKAISNEIAATPMQCRKQGRAPPVASFASSIASLRFSPSSGWLWSCPPPPPAYAAVVRKGCTLLAPYLAHILFGSIPFRSLQTAECSVPPPSPTDQNRRSQQVIERNAVMLVLNIRQPSSLIISVSHMLYLYLDWIRLGWKDEPG